MTCSSTTRISTSSLRLSPKVAIGCAVALAAMSGAVWAQSSQMAPSPNAGAEYLFYLPSHSPEADQSAIVQAFIDQGYEVRTYAYAGEPRMTYAKRVAGEIRDLIRQGVAPENISVVGAGSGSAIALLTSAAVGNRHVDYVVLGSCDNTLKSQYQFRPAGNVLGIRDVADSASGSCRPLWSQAPKLRARRDLVLDTGHGAALFSTAREEWIRPMVGWTRGGQVDVGDTKIAMVDRND